MDRIFTPWYDALNIEILTNTLEKDGMINWVSKAHIRELHFNFLSRLWCGFGLNLGENYKIEWIKLHNLVSSYHVDVLRKMWEINGCKLNYRHDHVTQ